MKFKGLVFMFFVLVLIGFSISSVFAISAAIGNGRMILRGDVGDNVERYVNVINQNDFDVVINISVSGDLENYVSLVDESFILSAGEERKAYFNIEFAKSGTTETKINVQFTPVDDEGGAGLSSNVIVIAEGDDSNYKERGVVEESIGGVVNFLTGGAIGIKDKSNKIIFSLITTTVIFVLFLIVLMLYAIKKKKMQKVSKEFSDDLKIVDKSKKSDRTKLKKSAKTDE